MKRKYQRLAKKSATNLPRHMRQYVFAALFVLIGTSLIILTRAAAPIASFEAENSPHNTAATVVTDNMASGGRAMRFGTPPASSGSPSGQPVPLGDLPGWRQILADEFTAGAAKGSWGSECDWERIAYRGENKVPGSGSIESRWRSYPRCFLDTYQRRPYRADEVLSVHDGILDFDLKPIDGQPAGANVSPLVSGNSQYQTYGRYDIRMRITNPNMPEYYTAFLLWPERDEDYRQAESDYPEGSLAAGVVHAFSHYSVNNDQESFSRAVDKTKWHTYTQEWGPGFRAYYLDGELIGRATRSIWSQPQRWQIQLETNTSFGNNNSRGHLEVDWVAVYAGR